MNVNRGELLRMADYYSEHAKELEKRGFVDAAREEQELADGLRKSALLKKRKRKLKVYSLLWI